MLKHLLIIFLCCMYSAQVLAAPIPPDVLTAYKASQSALAQKNFKSALKHAKTAWEKSETALGDNKVTGDLAYNYGYLASQLGKSKLAVEPLERSADLAHLLGDAAALTRLEREVELTTVLLFTQKNNVAKKRVDAALAFADEHNLSDAIFTGELWIYKGRIAHTAANSYAKRPKLGAENRAGKNAVSRTERIQSKSAQYAQKALDIFNKYPKKTQPQFKVLAHKLVGFSHERNKDWLDAVLSYQKAMLIEKKYSDLKDANYARTLGRWLNARSHVYRAGRSNKQVRLSGLGKGVNKYSDLELKGICKCWPYERESKIQPQSIKKVAPTMPKKARTSGFSIVRFDLADDGSIINPEIVHSWPLKTYDKSSLKALSKWQYEAKQDGKPGAQRTGIVQTLHYYLQSQRGDPI